MTWRTETQVIDEWHCQDCEKELTPEERHTGLFWMIGTNIPLFCRCPECMAAWIKDDGYEVSWPKWLTDGGDVA